VSSTSGVHDVPAGGSRCHSATRYGLSERPMRPAARLGAGSGAGGRLRSGAGAAAEGSLGAVPVSPAALPPAGLRVLELGSFIAGPFAGQLLGDLGAQVIKVEPPGTGDPMRGWGVTVDGRSLWWPAIARNKQSVAIDLRTDPGRSIVRD